MITPREELAQRFADMVKAKHAAGLPEKQAEVIALSQIVRDARSGLIDRDVAREFIIEEEVSAGRKLESATVHAEAVLAGKSSAWTKRDYGYEKARVRQRRPDLNAPSAESLAMSDQLSMWANRNLGGPSK